MKLTIVEKNVLSWTAMHIDFVMCKKSHESFSKIIKLMSTVSRIEKYSEKSLKKPEKQAQKSSSSARPEPSYFCSAYIKKSWLTSVPSGRSNSLQNLPVRRFKKKFKKSLLQSALSTKVQTKKMIILNINESIQVWLTLITQKVL